MKKALFFTIAFCMIATTAMAVDTNGRLGLGFVLTDEPIGGRYWFSEKVAIDVGVGFLSLDGFTDPDDATSTTSELNFRFGIGIPITIMNTGDRVNFNFHPRFRYASLKFDPLGGDLFTETASDIDILGLLEFEVFLTDDFALTAAHGLFVNLFDSGIEDSDSLTNFGTFGGNLTDFGLHYYFKAP